MYLQSDVEGNDYHKHHNEQEEEKEHVVAVLGPALLRWAASSDHLIKVNKQWC